MKNLPVPDERANSGEYKNYWIPRFEEYAKQPINWLNTASGLLKAASLLRLEVNNLFESIETMESPNLDYINLQKIFMMLVSFAAENLLKGIAIARDPSVVNSSGLKSWDGGGHDLTKLAENVQFYLTDDEKQLLTNLSVNGEWMGRYPCSMKHEDKLPRTNLNGGFSPLGNISKNDLNTAWLMCEKFKTTLENELQSS